MALPVQSTLCLPVPPRSWPSLPLGPPLLDDRQFSCSLVRSKPPGLCSIGPGKSVGFDLVVNPNCCVKYHHGDLGR